MKTILFAEDNDALRAVMEMTLTTMGYRVLPCCDAQIASATFHTQPEVDILLTDLEMPGRTGVELARELTGLRPTLPVMIITGSSLSAQELHETQDRRWIYVSKPRHLPALESTLAHILRADPPLRIELDTRRS